ncbi:MAG: isoprenylcysteine carboxylmethyltransferase family protein [bacterium]
MSFFAAAQLAGLGLFFGLAAGRAVRLRRRARLNAVAPGRASRLALVALVVTWCWAMLVLWYALPVGGRPLLPPLDTRIWDAIPVRLAGLALVAAGFALNVLAHRALGDNWRLGIDERHPGRLVTSGVYRFSRHPIYLFFNLYFLGTFLIEGRPLLLAWWVVVAVLLHFEARQEERFLAGRFGAAWQAYRARVRRYWGRRPAAA